MSDFHDKGAREKMESEGWDCSNKASWSKQVGHLKVFIWFDGLIYVVDMRTDKRIKQLSKARFIDAIQLANAILSGRD
jgi:hypothetical protein